MTNSPTLLRAAWLVPVTDFPVKDGALVLNENGTVLARGSFEEMSQKFPKAGVRDLGNAALMPGLVNAHCHLELSALKGKVPEGGGLVPWIKKFLAARTETSDPEIWQAFEPAIKELTDTGTVLVGDIANRLEHLGALEASPLHALVFEEIFHLDLKQAKPLFDEAVKRVENAQKSGRIHLSLAAHAPCTVSEPLFKMIRDYLKEKNLVTSFHLGEDEEENRLYLEGNGAWKDWYEDEGLGEGIPFPKGKTPTQYLDSIDFINSKFLAVHGRILSDDDIAILKARGASLCLCPRSNLYISGKLPPVEKFWKSGLNLCLGTDSLASNHSLNLFEEMACLSDNFPGIPPREILKMATVNGARALGFHDGLVSFEPGDTPKFIAVKFEGDVPEDVEGYLTAEASSRSIEHIK